MANLLRNYRDHWRLASTPARRYLFGAVLMGFAQAVTWSLLARYLDARGFSKDEVGSILASDALGKSLIALPAALWLARRSVRRTFMVAACLGGMAYFAMPFVESYRGLTWLNMFAGMCLAVHYVVIAPFLFRHTGRQERASIFGLAEAIRTTASVVGALLAGLLVSILMARWLLPDAALETIARAEADATGYAIQGAGVTSILAAMVYRTISDQREVLPDPLPVWSLLVEHKRIIARFALPQVFIALGSGFCIPFLPLYFKDRFALDLNQWGKLFAEGQVLMTLGLLASPWILGKLGYVKSIVAIELSSLPFFLLLALTMNLPVAAAAFLLRGALMNSTHPIHKNLMMNATPSDVREVQTGINATLWGFGWVLGPWLGGKVLLRTDNNYSLLMYTTMGCYVVAAILTYMLLIPLERGLVEDSV